MGDKLCICSSKFSVSKMYVDEEEKKNKESMKENKVSSMLLIRSQN